VPLIDDNLIDSLRSADGKFSHFALFLLGVIPSNHGSELPDESQWRPKLNPKISTRHLIAIKAQVRWMKRGTKKAVTRIPVTRIRPALKALRRLRRKINTKFKAILAMVDKEIASCG